MVGGGVSGLCLAQGLRQDGVDVTVYERDPALGSGRQGYRIHLDARAGLATSCAGSWPRRPAATDRCSRPSAPTRSGCATTASRPSRPPTGT
ncbi:MAG TPA: NAD(P)-binding protein [Streptomyces sp.]